ncbi:MAG: hypothetical protein AB7K41_04885 [Bdellovibrionales bacterium]
MKKYLMIAILAVMSFAINTQASTSVGSIAEYVEELNALSGAKIPSNALITRDQCNEVTYDGIVGLKAQELFESGDARCMKTGERSLYGYLLTVPYSCRFFPNTAGRASATLTQCALTTIR